MNVFRRALIAQLAGHAAAPQNGHCGPDSPTGTRLLCDLPGGCVCQVTALRGGHGLVARLAALGLIPGATVTVLQNPGHGPLIVLARESRLVLGRGEAAHVTVVPVPDADGAHTP